MESRETPPVGDTSKSRPQTLAPQQMHTDQNPTRRMQQRVHMNSLARSRRSRPVSVALPPPRQRSFPDHATHPSRPTPRLLPPTFDTKPGPLVSRLSSLFPLPRSLFPVPSSPVPLPSSPLPAPWAPGHLGTWAPGHLVEHCPPSRWTPRSPSKCMASAGDRWHIPETASPFRTSISTFCTRHMIDHQFRKKPISHCLVKCSD
jgi:hypothetical protein